MINSCDSPQHSTGSFGCPGPQCSRRRSPSRDSCLEGVNAKIRLIQRRGFGFRNLDALTAAIYLCLGGISLDLPTGT
ncbi:transposase [Dactylosporangium cerinum]|uniref:Transposase n=1 Tax=Dactylosporangium cerinum TaxID=1434730 RepID=A0ABV9WDW9_9ACTN